MKSILIVKNISREGSGILEDILMERKIPHQTVDLSLGETIPDVIQYAAVVICGGPDSANDSNKKINDELNKIREIISLGIPYLGICLGMQLLVKSQGGAVMKCPVKEIGFRDAEQLPYTVNLTENGKQDFLFKNIENRMPVFQLHGETVEITENMHLLAEGKHCRNQAIRVGNNAWGLQCHFELTNEMFELLLDEDEDLKNLNKELLRSDFAEIKERYFRNGRKLLENFLDIFS